MSDLIERYIYDVTRRLPEKSREEVGKELRADIGDMLSENPSEEEIKKVLASLGAPRTLANQYRGKQRYLISPDWMDEYLRTLQIVLIVICSISLFSSIISHVMYPTETTAIGIFAEVFSNSINGLIEGALWAFAVVTLIFVGIDHGKAKAKKEPWKPESLPKLPKKTEINIPRAGTIAGLICTLIFGTIFIMLLVENQKYIGWVETAGDTNIIPVFNNVVIQNFIPFFVLSLVFSACDSIVKLYYGKWNIATAAMDTVSSLVSAILFLVFIHQGNLFDAVFIAKVATFYGGEISDVTFTIRQVTNGFTVFIVLGVAVGLAKTWVQTLKHPQMSSEKSN